MRSRLGAALLAAAWLALPPSPAAGATPPGAATALSRGAQADAVSASAQGALEALPGRPSPPPLEPNVPWQDISAVTLVSLPFTAFWSVLGALAVAGISQGHFPPEIGTPMLAGAAIVAGSASLGIGLISVQWGGSKPRALSPTAEAAHPTPLPAAPSPPTAPRPRRLG